MASTVLYMSMSLDGFAAGPNETYENGLGDGGERLHEWVLGEPLDQLEGLHPRWPRHFRAGGRLGRRPPRRRAHLHPQSP
jgi:hypothetical protein